MRYIDLTRETFQESKGACGAEHFVCVNNAEATHASGSFGDCLSSMDCAMDYNMKTTLDSNDVVSFMWQMIPHHENAINTPPLPALRTQPRTPATAPWPAPRR